MTTNYNSNYDGTMPFSDTAFQVSLLVGADKTAPVPGDATTNYQAVFSYALGSNIYVGLNAAPTLPTAGSVTAQAYAEFRPEKRYVKGGDVLHFITPDATAFAGVTLRKL